MKYFPVLASFLRQTFHCSLPFGFLEVGRSVNNPWSCSRCCFNPLIACVALIQKPVNWFGPENQLMVSIWGQQWHLMGNTKIYFNLIIYTTYETISAFQYHLRNVKNLQNTHEGVLLLVKLQASGGCFSYFLNYTNGTKLPKASHMCFSSQSVILMLSLSYLSFLSYLHLFADKGP